MHNWCCKGARWALIVCFIVSAFCLSGSATAEEVNLTVVPNKCISLRKGQKCYQRIVLRWKTEVPGKACLWRVGDKEPLKCWEDELNGRYRHNFVATKTTEFYLTRSDSKEVVAQTEVKVSWIYNSRSSGRTRWRLF